MALSDRILVMYKGEIIGNVLREDATREGLGLLMAGVHRSRSRLNARQSVAGVCAMGSSAVPCVRR